MSSDPETYSYASVDPIVLHRLAVAYRDGLTERLQERQLATTEELPHLVFVGHASDPEPWTKFETSQDTHWYLGVRLTDDAELAATAYEFGRSDGEDHWF